MTKTEKILKIRPPKLRIEKKVDRNINQNYQERAQHKEFTYLFNEAYLKNLRAGCKWVEICTLEKLGGAKDLWLVQHSQIVMT